MKVISINFGFLLLFCVAGCFCLGQQEERIPKIAVVYQGQVQDVGWTFAHDQARLYLERNYNITVTLKQNIARSMLNETIIDLILKNHTIIFCNNFPEMIVRLAPSYPDVFFVLPGSNMAFGNNVAAVIPKSHQARYLSGVLAASMTKTNSLGYLAAFPANITWDGINAFIIGAKRVNPAIKVYVAYTRSWSNSTLENEAARIFIQDHNVDVVAQHLDGIDLQYAMNAANRWSIGYSTDMQKFAGDTVLTSLIFNWTIVYKHFVDKWIDGTWNSTQQEYLWWGIQEGLTYLAPYSNQVTQAARERVEQEKQLFLNGTDTVFCGNEVIEFGSQGGCLNVNQILSFNRTISLGTDLGVVKAPVTTAQTSDETSDESFNNSPSLMPGATLFLIFTTAVVCLIPL